MSIDIVATRARVIALPGSTGVDIALGLLAEIERLRKDARDAEQGARACDQIVTLLDGFPVEAPCPEAARVAALLVEVERLRAEVDLLQQEARIRRNINDGLAAEVDAERAAVVAWLRDNEDTWQMPAWKLADAIERGEHRREGER